MIRCNYIPPDGQSVIAVATQRGGTTDGDIQALRDRFGCKAEATHELSLEGSDDEQFSCVDHVGHLCSDGNWWVQPVYRASDDVSITIASMHGIARDGFGSPMIFAPCADDLSSEPLHVDASRVRELGERLHRAVVVDLGTNPTREQVEAAGFSSDSAAYREARKTFEPMPLPTSKTVGVARPLAAPGTDAWTDVRARIEADR